MPTVYKNYPLETLVRVAYYRIEVDANWKFATDNFSESYHTRTLHPQVPPWVDQDYWSSRVEMFPNGHGRTVQPMRPSLRDQLRAFDRDGTLWVEDLGSRNGTFVDGTPVHEAVAVGKGARLQVGETVLEVDR